MSAIEQWHEVMKVGGKEGASKLDSLLHDDVIFYSPVVFTPQKGKKNHYAISICSLRSIW